MSEAQETIADIVAEKRREAQYLIESAEASAMCGETMADTPYTEENLEFVRQDAKEMLAEADRLEAAAKRERVEVSVRAATSAINLTEEKWKGESGLREAVELCDKIINDGTIVCNCDIVDEARAKIRAALALFTDSPENENSGADNVTAGKQEMPGDAAKLREALVNISRYADCAAMRPNDAQTQEYIEQIRKWANAALGEPPRNCDRFGGDIEKLREACLRERGMSEAQETLVDIVAEMRHGLDQSWHDVDREWAHGLADRIEATAKRAYNEIDHAVCAIEEAFSYDIDNVREAMNGTIGDYHESE